MPDAGSYSIVTLADHCACWLEEEASVEEAFWSCNGSLWPAVLDSIRPEEGMQQKLMYLVLALKRRSQPANAKDGWLVWGSRVKWSDLPLLGPLVRERFNCKLCNWCSLDLVGLKLGTIYQQHRVARALLMSTSASCVSTRS